MDFNHVVLAGQMMKLEHRKIGSSTGSFNVCTITVKTESQLIKVDVKSPSDKAIDAFKYKAAAQAWPARAIILGGQMTSTWDKKREKYWYKVTVTPSNLQMFQLPEGCYVSSTDNQVHLAGRIGHVSQDRCMAVVECKYRYFSKKQNTNIEASNYVTVVLSKPIQPQCIGSRILVRGSVASKIELPGLTPEWRSHVHASDEMVI